MNYRVHYNETHYPAITNFVNCAKINELNVTTLVQIGVPGSSHRNNLFVLNVVFYVRQKF